MNLPRTPWLLPTTMMAAACLLMTACNNQAPTANASPDTPTPVEAVQAPEAPATTAPEEAVAVAPEAPVAPPAPAAPAPAPKPVSAPAPKPRPPVETTKYAQVVSVTPVRQSIDNPHEVCRDVEVTYQVAPKDDNKITGTVAGAAVGAAVGNQIGDGRGKDAARIAGIVGGAIAGRKIQENQQKKNTETRIERQCETVNDPTTKIVGYDIVYSFDGQTHSARVAEDPGERIKLPVRSIDE